MFKRLKVGKKLMVGFGAIVLTIVVLAGVVVTTSVQRTNDLTRADTLSTLAAEANALLDSFNDTQVNCLTAFSSMDAEVAYASAYTNMAQVFYHMDNIEALSQQLGGYNSDVNQELHALLLQFRQAIEAVQANDAVLEPEIDLLQTKAVHLTELSDSVLEEVVAITIGELQENAGDAVFRLEKIVMPMQALCNRIDTLTAANALMIAGMNLSDVGAMQEDIAALHAAAPVVRANMSSPQARAGIDELLEALEEYEAALARFIPAVQHTDAVALDATGLMARLKTMVNAGVDGVTADASGLIHNTLGTMQITLYITIALTVLSIVCAVLIAWRLTRAFTRPLVKMEAVLLQAGGSGDLDFSEAVRNSVLEEAAAKDELGSSIGAFARFVDRVRYIGDILESVAEGDLTHDVELLGENDTLGNALAKMTRNLNEMFAEINSISQQVATGSGEIAQGAQSLAQGASEQASTVEEISASVAEIAQQAKISVDTAGKATQDAATIRDIALDGNSKMQQMIGAVREMNQSSHAISQVIKVIDDIAFQTNILALNAAVEAARAGAHGKGFAVVADEVRNLAAKSATAAQETAGLISANVEKAEFGLGIAQQTAESLERIVEGIQASSASMQLVAEQSQGSQVATVQVNVAVDQVALVIQHNSAASQQSAAASQEMNSQAQILQHLIARFKLAKQPARLPPA